MCEYNKYCLCYYIVANTTTCPINGASFFFIFSFFVSSNPIQKLDLYLFVVDLFS